MTTHFCTIRAWLRQHIGFRDDVSLPENIAVGAWGETVAEKALQRKGYRVLGRRVRIGRHDEIDLIMRHGGVLVFIEVKTRSSENYGRPAAAIGRRKRHALSRAARRYLMRLRTRPDYYRFDVVEVIGSPDSAVPPTVRHYEAALTVSTAPFPL